jgi:hypothetical protein
MAMRLYCREEWRNELQEKWRLTPTGVKTATTEIWVTGGGKPLSIPDLGEGPYPDSLLNLVEYNLRLLNEHPFEKPDGTLKQPEQPTK